MVRGDGCKKVYENMLGENILCGSIRHDSQGVGMRLCDECRAKRDANCEGDVQ